MCTNAELIILFQQMPVFGGMSESALDFIISNSSNVSFESEDFVFVEGEQATSFYVLTHGEVVVEKTWNGVPVELRRLIAGDCVGEMAIIDLQPRSASVRALTDCIALEITRSTLHELFKNDLEQYASIMMNMGREVSRRLRAATSRLFEIEQSMPT